MSREQDLLLRAVRGDTDAINGLVTGYRPLAFRIARSILGDQDGAEDVAQDAMVRLTAALPGFRQAAELDPWVYRVTLNRCRDHLRTRKRRAGHVALDEAAPNQTGLALEEEPERAVDAERARAALELALARLPTDQQTVLRLRFIDGLPYAEIARVTATAQGTIASRVFRALRRLGQELDPRHLEVLQ